MTSFAHCMGLMLVILHLLLPGDWRSLRCSLSESCRSPRVHLSGAPLTQLLQNPATENCRSVWQHAVAVRNGADKPPPFLVSGVTLRSSATQRRGCASARGGVSRKGREWRGDRTRASRLRGRGPPSVPALAHANANDICLVHFSKLK